MATIRRVLRCSFALLLLAGRLPFLAASGRGYIVIDFKGEEITQERLLKGLEHYKKWYIKECKQLAEAFARAADKNGKLAFKNGIGRSFVRDYITPFNELIFPGNWDDIQIDDKDLQRLYFKAKDNRDRRKVFEAVKFVIALKTLKYRRTPNDSDAVKAEEILYDEAKKFVEGNFPPILKGFIDEKGSPSDMKITICLKNGEVSAKTSCELFENFEKPFRLEFWNVQGSFYAGEQLKKCVLSLIFRNLVLEFTEKAFENASLLKKLEISEDEGKQTVLVFGERSFANCRYLKSPFKTNNAIKLDKNRPGKLVSAFEDCPRIDKEHIQEEALAFFNENVENEIWQNVEQNKIYLKDNQLDEAYIGKYYGSKLKEKQNEVESLWKQYQALTAKYHALEKENERLKNNCEAFREKTIRPLEQKNRELKQLLTKKEEEFQETSQKLSRVTSKYEKLEKQHAEIVESNKKRFEEKCNECNLTRKNFLNAKEQNKELREKVKNLEKGNEAQKEKIETLEAYIKEYEDKINKATKLEAENEQLKQQLDKETKDRITAEIKLDQKDKNHEESLGKKDKKIDKLENDLKNTQSESTKKDAIISKLRVEIKELKTSESYVLTTMDIIADEEEPKEEVKNDDFRLNFQKDTFQKNQSSNEKKPFYPKKKGKKGKYVPFVLQEEHK